MDDFRIISRCQQGETQRNPLYHGPQPAIETIRYRVFEEFDQAIDALEQGEIQYLGNIWRPEDLNRLEALTDSHTIYRFSSHIYYYLELNFNVDAFGPSANPWLDLRVRQALAHALDIEAIIAETRGSGIRVNSPIVPACWSYSAQHTHEYCYDVGAAARLLDEAGWLVGEDGWRYKDGQSFEVDLPHTQAHKQFAELVKAIWQSWASGLT